MKQFILLILITIPTLGYAQLGVAFHQSSIPFLEINYEISNRLRPALRIATDNFFGDTSFEAVVTYDIIKKNSYEFYVGAGGKTNNFAGIVVPVGLNIYPLSSKAFGFQMELAPIIGDDVLRGSWGIRYRFGNEN